MVLANKRILVIDDDPAVRHSCQRVLAEHGCEVEMAATGQEGLEQARRGYFDCAVVDLRMPDVDGMEIIRQARRTRSGMALLIVTGHAAVETAAEAVRLGVCDYLCKPFGPDEIVRAVERAMARSSPPPAVAVDTLTESLQPLAVKSEHFEYRPPPAVAQVVAGAGARRAILPILNTSLLGILAGAYIGFGAALATLVGSDAASRFGVGLSQIMMGLVFSVGLVLVIIAGGELFTGNNLMVTSVLDKRCGAGRVLGRWGIVYAANFAGSLMLAWIMLQSGVWKLGASAVGAKAVAIAAAKTSLPFGEAFFRGVGCNWLVCLAVWMSLSAKEIAGKVLVIVLPIMAFVALGYEHCVANMYFIPLGLWLKDLAGGGLPAASLENLTWVRFVLGNLVPVTLGNIVGGAVFVGGAYWVAYLRRATPRP